MSGPSYLSSRELAAQPPGGEGLAVRKSLPTEIDQVDDADRTIRFRISTAGVDHEGDRIQASGWRLDVYRRNPVVIWAHDYRGLPIARAVEVGTLGDDLWSLAQFATRDLNPFADRVFRMTKAGYLNAASVAFVANKWTMRDKTADDPGGVNFEEQTLVEWSVCPVPANPEALVEGRELAGGLAEIEAWAKAILLERGLEIVESDELERLKAAASGREPEAWRVAIEARRLRLERLKAGRVA